MVTTIQLDKKTKSKLDKLRLFPKETYDDIIKRLLNAAEPDEILSEETIKDIEEGLKDIKEGRVYTTKQLEKKTRHLANGLGGNLV